MTELQLKQRKQILEALIQNEKFTFDVSYTGRCMMLVSQTLKDFAIIVVLGFEFKATAYGSSPEDEYTFDLELDALISYLSGLE